MKTKNRTHTKLIKARSTDDKQILQGRLSYRTKNHNCKRCEILKMIVVIIPDHNSKYSENKSRDKPYLSRATLVSYAFLSTQFSYQLQFYADYKED